MDAYHSTLDFTALHAAVDAGRTKVVKLLASLGASIHLPRKVWHVMTRRRCSLWVSKGGWRVAVSGSSYCSPPPPRTDVTVPTHPLACVELLDTP